MEKKKSARNNDLKKLARSTVPERVHNSRRVGSHNTIPSCTIYIPKASPCSPYSAACRSSTYSTYFLVDRNSIREAQRKRVWSPHSVALLHPGWIAGREVKSAARNE